MRELRVATNRFPTLAVWNYMINGRVVEGVYLVLAQLAGVRLLVHLFPEVKIEEPGFHEGPVDNRQDVIAELGPTYFLVCNVLPAQREIAS